MLTMLVEGALTVLDGAAFDSRDACPACGGTLSGYDTKKRRFACLITGAGTRTITVSVKRFRCRSCGRLCNADEPFYPKTRIGAPVIDLCNAFSRTFGYGRAARNLTAMGVAVDRMQCRHYMTIPAPKVPVMPVYGFPLPRSVLSLSQLTARFPEGAAVPGAEALAASGFPSAYRAAPRVPAPGDKGDEGDEQEGKEERDAGKPEQGTHQE